MYIFSFHCLLYPPQTKLGFCVEMYSFGSGDQLVRGSVVYLLVDWFVCLFKVFRPTREFFTHFETSPLPMKG